MDTETIKREVRRRYRSVVTGERTCCGADAETETRAGSCCGSERRAAESTCCGSQAQAGASSCCASEEPAAADTCCESTGCGCGQDGLTARGEAIGYSADELSSVPEGANMGLGCGNPTAVASLQEGETVLDLGSGGGFDCFLAAQRVGPSGRAIGVDFTPEMIERARDNAARGGYQNVEFRLGELEHLPVADNSVDCIISNCVINLVPDKEQVFRECHRVLKPGGRIMVSDIVLNGALPEEIQQDVRAYTGCIAGASLKQDYLTMLRAAGFRTAEIASERTYTDDQIPVPPGKRDVLARALQVVVSANITATK